MLDPISCVCRKKTVNESLKWKRLEEIDVDEWLRRRYIKVGKLRAVNWYSGEFLRAQPSAPQTHISELATRTPAWVHKQANKQPKNKVKAESKQPRIKQNIGISDYHATIEFICKR